MSLEKLIKLMEVSVKRNGKDTPLTLGHFLNILKLAQRKLQEESDEESMQEGFDHF